jgi:hypothetical protein
LQFVFNQYFKALLMIALSTIIFVAVNNLISVLPEGLVISPSGARVVETTTSSPSGSSTIYNINYVEHFNEISGYWVSLDPTITWYVSSGVLRATLSSEGSLNNVLYYSVDLIDVNHTEVSFSGRTYVYYPDQRESGVVLLSSDLSTRLYITFYAQQVGGGYYGDIKITAYRNGVVVSQKTITSYSSANFGLTGWTQFSVKITRTSPSSFSIYVSVFYEERSSSFSTTTTIDFGSEAYFDFFGVAVIRGSGLDTIDYVEVWITSPDATETVYYNVNTPPPCPCECPECPCLSGEVYIPLRLMGQFVAFTSYILFIVTALKNIIPEL